MVSPASKRRVVSYILREYETVAAVSERWACKLIGLNRSTFRYEPCPARLDTEAAFVAAVREACGRKHCRRYGYRRITEVLNGEGWHVNPKRTRRVMREEGLTRKPWRQRKRAKGVSANSCSLLKPREVNDVWSLLHESVAGVRRWVENRVRVNCWRRGVRFDGLQLLGV